MGLFASCRGLLRLLVVPSTAEPQHRDKTPTPQTCITRVYMAGNDSWVPSTAEEVLTSLPHQKYAPKNWQLGVIRKPHLFCFSGLVFVSHPVVVLRAYMWCQRQNQDPLYALQVPYPCTISPTLYTLFFLNYLSRYYRSSRLHK